MGDQLAPFLNFIPTKLTSNDFRSTEYPIKLILYWYKNSTRSKERNQTLNPGSKLDWSEWDRENLYFGGSKPIKKKPLKSVAQFGIELP